MKELKPRIHENGIDYILVGDYYVPDWKAAGGTPSHWQVGQSSQGVFENRVALPSIRPLSSQVNCTPTLPI